MIQNSAARLVFNEPKRAHVTPLFVSLHWLPVAACIQFKTLMLAYRTTTGSAPTYFHSLITIYIPSRSPAYFHSLLRIYIPSRSPAYFHSLLRIYIPSRSPAYFHSLLRIYIPSRSLRSASERRLVVPSQRGSKSLSRTFSFTVPGCWNDLQTPPPPSGPLDPCQSTSNNWKLISFETTWLHPCVCTQACIYLNNAWDLVLRALPLSVCLFKMNRFMYSPIVSLFG